MIGRPVTEATERAAPPRASPSSFESTTPVKSTPSWKAWAVSTAAWPIIASMTKRTSSGWIAARMSAACCMRFSSIARRPAVSTMTTSCWRARRRLDALAGDGDRVTEGAGALPRVEDRVVAPHVAALGGEHRHAGPLAHDLELGHGVGPLQVGRHQHRRVPLLLEPPAELAGEGRLARALEAGQHDHRRRVLRELQRAGLAPEDADELVVDDLDDLLGRVERAGDLGAERPLAHGVGEVLDHRKRHVGVEQRHPDVADGAVDVGLGEPPLVPEVLEGGCQAVRKAREHARSRSGTGSARRSVTDRVGGAPSQVSMIKDTVWATFAGDSSRPPNSVT